jgi:hypothetical protein
LNKSIIYLKGIRFKELFIKTDAITAIGIYEKTGRIKITIMRTTTELINCDILLVAPDVIFTEVLTKTPVHGNPPRNPDKIFPNAIPNTSYY